MKNLGLTLVEVIVSLVIFSLMMMGLSQLFIATKRTTLNMRSYLVAGQLVRHFLEPLQTQVDASTWGNNCISTTGINTAFCSNTTPYILDNRTYTPSFDVNQITNIPGVELFRVSFTVAWTEESPN